MTIRRHLLAPLAVALLSTATADVRAGTGEPEPEVGETYALLVGVQGYEGDPASTRFAEADVNGLSEVLRGVLKIPADHMVVMTGQRPFRWTPTKAHILEQLELLLAGLREPDTLIVALAGQGVQFQEDDDPYFCPIDARLADRKTLISLGAVGRMIEQSRGKLKLLLVEAGRNDPTRPDPQVRGESPGAKAQAKGVGRASWPSDPGAFVVYSSCSRGGRSYEDESSGHGVFFRYLIDGFRGQADLNDDGLGTLGEFRTYVDRNVRNHVRDRHTAHQQPEFVGDADPNTILVAFKPANLLLRRGEELFEKRRYEDVIDLCTRLLRHDPRHARAYHLRGKARSMDDRDGVAAAIDDFTAALQNEPGFAEARFDRGYLYLEAGEPDRAIEDFNAAVRPGQAGRDVVFYRGMAHLQRDRFEEAAADFTEAIRVGPALPAAFLNRGVARYRQDRLKEALDDYETAIKLDPKMARAYLNRGVVRMRLGDLDGAINDLGMAIDQARRTGDFAMIALAYFDRGKAFFLAKDYARAIGDWEWMTRNLDDPDSMTLDFLGMAHARLGDETKAARYFEDAVRLDVARAYAPAHAHLGAVRLAQGNPEAAVRECTVAIEIDPTFAEAHSTRGRAHRELKQADRAEADETKAERLRERRQDARGTTEVRRN